MLGHTGLALEIIDDAPEASAAFLSVGGGGIAGALSVGFTAANHPARICWVGLGDRHRLGLAFNEMLAMRMRLNVQKTMG